MTFDLRTAISNPNATLLEVAESLAAERKRIEAVIAGLPPISGRLPYLNKRIDDLRRLEDMHRRWHERDLLKDTA